MGIWKEHKDGDFLDEEKGKMLDGLRAKDHSIGASRTDAARIKELRDKEAKSERAKTKRKDSASRKTAVPAAKGKKLVASSPGTKEGPKLLEAPSTVEARKDEEADLERRRTNIELDEKVRARKDRFSEAKSIPFTEVPRSKTINQARVSEAPPRKWKGKALAAGGALAAAGLGYAGYKHYSNPLGDKDDG